MTEYQLNDIEKHTVKQEILKKESEYIRQK